MSQELQGELVEKEIEANLAALPEIAILSPFIKEALARTTGRLSGKEDKGSRPWLLLPLIVCESISGEFGPAVPVAAALHFSKAAAELFDDIEDQDTPRALYLKWGLPIATNIATMMLILSEKAITGLQARGIPDQKIVHIMDKINSYHWHTCTGQHRDLSISPGAGITEEDYLSITGMKSASQLECACYTGAYLATEDGMKIKAFARFGYNLGMAVQIANDIKGIAEGYDIIKHKTTLPAIYGLAQAEGEDLSRLTATYKEYTGATADPVEIKDILFRTGAIYYATVKIEMYKQAAVEALATVEDNGVETHRFKELLEQR